MKILDYQFQFDENKQIYTYHYENMTDPVTFDAELKRVANHLNERLGTFGYENSFIIDENEGYIFIRKKDADFFNYFYQIDEEHGIPNVQRTDSDKAAIILSIAALETPVEKRKRKESAENKKRRKVEEEMQKKMATLTKLSKEIIGRFEKKEVKPPASPLLELAKSPFSMYHSLFNQAKCLKPIVNVHLVILNHFHRVNEETYQHDILEQTTLDDHLNHMNQYAQELGFNERLLFVKTPTHNKISIAAADYEALVMKIKEKISIPQLIQQNPSQAKLKLLNDLMPKALAKLPEARPKNIRRSERIAGKK